MFELVAELDWRLLEEDTAEEEATYVLEEALRHTSLSALAEWLCGD